MEILLIRHPHTINNALGRFPGTEATPYTKRGEDEFNQLLTYHYPDWMIYTSPHKRCTQVARAIAARRREQLCIDMRLREIECGDFANLTFAEIEQQYPAFVKVWFEDAENFSYPNGESRQALNQRVLTFLKELKHNAIIISHQAVLHVISLQFGDERTFSTGEMRLYEYPSHP